MGEKDTLPPLYKIILMTHYPLPVEQQPPIPPSSGTLPSPSPLPKAEPESLGDDQIETEETFLEAQASDTTEKRGKMKSERRDQFQRGEILLLHVFGKDIMKCKIKPERRALESQRAPIGVEGPRPLCLSSREMQRTAVLGLMHANNSGLEGFFLPQAVIRMKPEETTSEVTKFQYIVILPKAWQQEEVVKLSSEQHNKRFDPSG